MRRAHHAARAIARERDGERVPDPLEDGDHRPVGVHRDRAGSLGDTRDALPAHKAPVLGRDLRERDDRAVVVSLGAIHTAVDPGAGDRPRAHALDCQRALRRDRIAELLRRLVAAQVPCSLRDHLLAGLGGRDRLATDRRVVRRIEAAAAVGRGDRDRRNLTGRVGVLALVADDRDLRADPVDEHGERVRSQLQVAGLVLAPVLDLVTALGNRERRGSVSRRRRALLGTAVDLEVHGLWTTAAILVEHRHADAVIAAAGRGSARHGCRYVARRADYARHLQVEVRCPARVVRAHGKQVRAFVQERVGGSSDRRDRVNVVVAEPPSLDEA